jgi:hypothetical protein
VGRSCAAIKSARQPADTPSSSFVDDIASRLNKGHPQIALRSSAPKICNSSQTIQPISKY